MLFSFFHYGITIGQEHGHALLACANVISENVPVAVLFGVMALREIIGRIVDGILSFVTELISFIMFVSTKERRSLHDMVAGTVVLHDPNKVIPQ